MRDFINAVKSRDLKLTFYFLSVLLISILLVIYRIEYNFKEILVVLFLAAASVVMFNFRMSLFLMIVVMFLPYMFVVHQVVFFSIFLLFISFITYGNISIDEIRNPLLNSILLFMLFSLPGLYNSTALILSLRDMLNLVALVSTFVVIMIGAKDEKSMMRILYLYIVLVFLHSLHVGFLGITTGKRVFGILNVFYIDFAGLGSVITFILMLFNKGLKRLMFLFFFTIITLGLIFTQTRNAWLSTAFALSTLILFLLIKGEKIKISRLGLGLLLAGILSLAVIISLNSSVDVVERLDVNKQTVALTDDPESVGTNSFVSRVLIWHTAVMAFAQHPLIGIGPYAFRHTSQNFYTIPKPFFKMYVENRTPHITYLQVITETGVIGFIVFMFFIFKLVRYLVATLKYLPADNNKALTLMIIWSLIYIVFSMMMTESWLYCQYIVWLGVLLGLLVNNRKRLGLI